MKLTNKVALVTGGSSGIGRAICFKLAREGAKVVVADVEEAAGRETVEQLRQEGLEASFHLTDVTEYAQVEAAVNFAAQTYGRLDIMCNNAGIAILAPLLEHTPEAFDRVLKVNQYGVYHGILAASRKMIELGIQGVIINTASILAFVATQGLISYHASKGAVKMMTQAAAVELAQHNIRVVAVAPGVVDTAFIQGLKDLGLESQLASKHMRGQLLKPEAIADSVYLLCLEEANLINGTTVMVDDGYFSMA
jgi:glucose 1-dehydrogenase